MSIQTLAAAAAWNPTWLIELLDVDDNPIMALDGVTSGRITLTQGTPVGESGELTFDQRLPDEVDWHHQRVRLTRDPGVVGVDPWPVATLLFQRPRHSQRDGASSRNVQLIGKLARLERWSVGQVFTVPEGTNPVNLAAALIQDKLGGSVSVTPTDKTLSAPLVYEPSDSWLKITNELVRAAGYRSVWCDGYGTPQLGPYTLPADRPSVATLTDENGLSLHLPEWEYTPDMEIPNHVILEQQGTGDEPGIVVEAWNDDPTDPYSIINSPITSHAETAEFTDLETGHQLARRKLIDLREINNDLDITCATLPLMRTDRFAFRDQGSVYDATVWEIEYSIEDLADMRVLAKEVTL